MATWFNPRVAVVTLSILVLMGVSKVSDPLHNILLSSITCAVLYALYVLAFLAPLWQCLGVKRVVWPAITLTAAWTAVLLGMVADELPITLAERMERSWNRPMTICCVAATIAFFFFFQSTARALHLRDEILEVAIGGRGDK